MTTFLVNTAGLALMAAIVWWFWLSPRAGKSDSAPQQRGKH
ncbi:MULTISPECIES: hypothetical protein [Marinobacter]|uniref:Uncharacterized protein n=1 Tax=Marinobacter xestospongiae TaxID=994319 RepID=A0ABU3VVG8_9GAMM|nr:MULTISPECIES: hypothetical protein [Marinobacter]MDV2078155.1 hypothetical protein [Marinobacter xestospongiae]